jgi:hypothetical protein
LATGDGIHQKNAIDERKMMMRWERKRVKNDDDEMMMMMMIDDGERQIERQIERWWWWKRESVYEVPESRTLNLSKIYLGLAKLYFIGIYFT